jgi:hypothetical protein
MLTQSTVTKGPSACADAWAPEADGAALAAGAEAAAVAASEATRSSVCWPHAVRDRVAMATLAVASRVLFTP